MRKFISKKELLKKNVELNMEIRYLNKEIVLLKDEIKSKDYTIKFGEHKKYITNSNMNYDINSYYPSNVQSMYDSSVSNLYAKIKCLKKEKEELKKHLDEVVKENGYVKKNNKILAKQIDYYEKKINEIKQQDEDLDNLVNISIIENNNELIKRNKTLRGENEQLKIKVKAYGEALDQLEQTIKNLGGWSFEEK